MEENRTAKLKIMAVKNIDVKVINYILILDKRPHGVSSALSLTALYCENLTLLNFTHLSAYFCPCIQIYIICAAHNADGVYIEGLLDYNYFWEV